MKKVLKRVLGDPQARTLKRLKKRVEDINKLAGRYEKLSDKQLRDQTAELKKELEKNKGNLDKILPDAFAVVREAATRTLKQRHYDVQLMGGMALHEGSIAEMKTGEGKTLVATLPIYLNALTGKGVHFVTVNEYLTQRDAGWMGQIYNFLGLSVGVIIPDQSFIYDDTFNNQDHEDPRFKHLRPCTRQEAYAADITYGTNNEYGFDYLRDNMVRDTEQLRQRPLNFAIVDEADSILVDEARTPLIISAPASEGGAAYEQFSKIVRQLKSQHYEVDEKKRSVVLTDEGVDEVEKILGIKDLYISENIRTIYHLEQSLKAQTLFKRDKDYVVTNDGEIVIVDEFTGRLLRGRRYNEGLHQAIEAKEGVPVQEESMTLATISFQNYFRLYEKLSGMTGTASTEAEEFHQIYKLDVIEIPPNRKLIREDLPDRIYRSEAGKFKAIVREVKILHKKGQPVLIGTVSIERNETLSKLLKSAGVPHQILNAKNNEKEATIVSKAGQKGAVTLATNIAGRGTDIVLDDEAKKAGGLFVLGSERHESRRIDNQLRGRAGRQGDPGKTQFYVSCEDDLMRIFGGDRILRVMEKLQVAEDMPIENSIISRSLEGAQKKVEGHNFDIRKNVVQYDDVMNRHRKAIYAMRREILGRADISARIKQFITDQVMAFDKSPLATTELYEEQILEVFPLDSRALDDLFESESSKFARVLKEQALSLYQQSEDEFGEELYRKVERDIYLQIMDNLWMQHLENMDHLREGIGWIAVGQRDPLVEYRRQAQRLFDELLQQLRHDVLAALMRVRPVNVSTDQPIETALTRAARQSVDNADKILDTEEFKEVDFVSKKTAVAEQKVSSERRKKTRKVERQRKKSGKRSASKKKR